MPELPVSFKPQWRCIGPFRGGRVGAVAGDVSDANVFYFGACAGGVWKTTDAGVYWANVSDGFFTTASIGAIAVAESDPNVIYVGSGESTTRSNISPGDGVYKSTDAGRTWQNVGLRDSRHIGKIAIHPQPPSAIPATPNANVQRFRRNRNPAADMAGPRKTSTAPTSVKAAIQPPAWKKGPATRNKVA